MVGKGLVHSNHCLLTVTGNRTDPKYIDDYSLPSLSIGVEIGIGSDHVRKAHESRHLPRRATRSDRP